MTGIGPGDERVVFQNGQVVFKTVPGPSPINPKGPVVSDTLTTDGYCCCCDCFGADQPYTLTSTWNCITANYNPLSSRTYLTFNISGTVAAKGYWEFISGSWFDWCAGTYGTPPTPAGTWTFTLGTGSGSAKWTAGTYLCETASNWYVQTMCIVFEWESFHCNTTNTVCKITIITSSFPLSKAAYPTLPSEYDGVWRTTSNCVNDAGAESLIVEYKMPNPPGYDAWQYENGEWTDGTDNYMCKESCNNLICVPKCITSVDVKSTTYNSSPRNGINLSGLTITPEFS